MKTKFIRKLAVSGLTGTLALASCTSMRASNPLPENWLGKDVEVIMPPGGSVYGITVPSYAAMMEIKRGGMMACDTVGLSLSGSKPVPEKYRNLGIIMRPTHAIREDVVKMVHRKGMDVKVFDLDSAQCHVVNGPVGNELAVFGTRKEVSIILNGVMQNSSYVLEEGTLAKPGPAVTAEGRANLGENANSAPEPIRNSNGAIRTLNVPDLRRNQTAALAARQAATTQARKQCGGVQGTTERKPAARAISGPCAASDAAFEAEIKSEQAEASSNSFHKTLWISLAAGIMPSMLVLGFIGAFSLVRHKRKTTVQ